MRPGTYQGINYYTRYRARYCWFFPRIHACSYDDPRAQRTAEFEIYPSGIYKGLSRIKNRYCNPQIVITENGSNEKDRIGVDPLDDEARIGYIADHLALLRKAMDEGVNCLGYFVWSLLDNFEWDYGLSVRAGLLRTDFLCLTTTWKKSAYWYHDLVTNGKLHMKRLPRIDPAP